MSSDPASSPLPPPDELQRVKDRAVGLRSGNTHFAPPGLPFIDHRSALRGIYAVIAEAMGHAIPPLTEVFRDEPPLAARVDAGRWVVDCPTCRGAEFVFFDTLLFLCFNCYNATQQGRWRQVAVPPENTRQQIEDALLVRPFQYNRFWFPGESVDDLAAENELYLPAPPAAPPVPERPIPPVGPPTRTGPAGPATPVTLRVLNRRLAALEAEIRDILTGPGPRQEGT